MSSDQDHDKSYANIKEMIDAANELYKVGDTGTERFKSITGMLDVFGRTDPENFANSLDKLNRYFKDTEDSSTGMVNFLKDLEEHNLASYAADTDTWALSLGNLAEAAKTMGIGYEPFLALLDELQAKGFDIAVFDSLEDGYQRVGELQAELSTEQAKLNAMQQEGSGATQEEIDAQSQKVDELIGKYNTARDAVKNFQEQAQESMKLDQEIAKSMGADLLSTANKVRNGVGSEDQQQMNKYALISQRNALQQQLKDMKVEFGPAFDIDNFGDLKDQIDEINKVLEETFGEEYKIDYTLEGEELTDGETTGTMNVTAGIVNVAGEIADNVKEKANQETTTSKMIENNAPKTQTVRQGMRDANAGIKPDRSVKQHTVETKTLDIQVNSSSAEATMATLETRADELADGKTITFEADVDGAVETVSAVADQDGNITFTAGTGEAERQVAAIQNPDGTISYTANTGGIDAQVAPHLNKHGTIDFSITANIGAKVQTVVSQATSVVRNALGSVRSRLGLPQYTGTLNGFAGGTIRAFASGSRVSIDKDQDAIVNELGEFTPRINLFNCGETLRVLYTTT